MSIIGSQIASSESFKLKFRKIGQKCLYIFLAIQISNRQLLTL